MKPRKWALERIIQGHFGHGWEDVSAYDVPKTRDEAKAIMADLREYRASGPEPYRLISRRVRNPDSAET